MKQFIFLILFAFSTHIYAQNKTRVLELGASSEASIGVGFGTFYTIRPLIKWGKNFTSLHRFRLDQASINLANYDDQTYLNINTGIFFGHEWRNLISDKLYFVHAPEIGLNYYGGTNYSSQTYGAHYRFGLLYKANEKLNFSIETPISFEQNWSSNSNGSSNSSTNFSLFNQSNLLTITYAI